MDSIKLHNATQGRILDVKKLDLVTLYNLDFKSSYNFSSKVKSDIHIDYTDNYSLATIYSLCGQHLMSVNSLVSLYCFRHAIELYIKFCLSLYSNDGSILRLIQREHNLLILYNKFYELTRMSKLKTKLAEIEPIIKEFNNIEDKENSYRYGEMSKSLNKYKFDLNKINDFVDNLRILCEFWYQLCGGDFELVRHRYNEIFEEIRKLRDIFISILEVNLKENTDDN